MSINIEQVRRDCVCGISIPTDDVLELVGMIEENEIERNEIFELKTKVESHRQSLSDYSRRMSKLKGLSRYMYDRVLGMQNTPHGMYVLVEDIEDEVLQSDM